jgi:hypothetical protein
MTGATSVIGEALAKAGAHALMVGRVVYSWSTRIGWRDVGTRVAGLRMRAWMEVFSSAESTYSTRRGGGWLSKRRGHRSRTQAALRRRTRGAREDPGAVLPGVDGVQGQPAPDCGAGDGRDKAVLDRGSGQVGAEPAGERFADPRGQSAGQRL